MAVLLGQMPAIVNRAVRVLVVDDDALLGAVLKECLVDAGYEVRVVQDGNEALGAMRHQRPDVIVLELQLPTMDGLTFVETLRAHVRWSQVPIIAVSAMPDLAATAERLGVGGCLAKPLDFELLLEQLQQLTADPEGQRYSGE